MNSMNYILTLLFFVSGISLTHAQNMHIETVAVVPMGITGNDCWGYVDSSGTEYAIMGLQNKAVIYSLESPDNPRFVGEFPGSSSTWRDIKSWNNYIYVVTEAQDGILIINMEDTSNITSVFYAPTIPLNGQSLKLKSAHNIYIDEGGYAYLAGTKIGKGGVVILDLNTDPEHPAFVGIENGAYAHDVVAQRDTMLTSDIYNGVMTIWDVHDKANPIELGKTRTTSYFTHNAWPSADGKYAFTTDERGEGRLDAYDISDVQNIRRLDSYKPMDGINRGVIPHNTHYLNGFLITSWYTDGVKIIDAHRPDNLVEVGSYKTHKGADGGFGGCWGAFPYYPSGLIIASDRAEGLFVLRPDFQRACYLEGKITDRQDGTPIQSVTVRIEAAQYSYEMSDIEGDYKTGLADSGMYTVTFEHPEYKPLTKENIRLDHGKVTILDVELERKEAFLFTGKVLEAGTNTPIPNAWVHLTVDQRSVELVTDATGDFQTTLLSTGSAKVNVSAGKWGYLHQSLSDAALDRPVTLTLIPGYQDDFIGEQHWTIRTDAASGGWERAVPTPIAVGGPTEDLSGDLGSSCYVTGNNGTQIGADDIDDGTTQLTSPSMDLSVMDAPIVSLQYWFNNFGGAGTPPNDTLLIYLVQNNEMVPVLKQTHAQEAWIPFQFAVRDYLKGDLSDVKVKVICGDYDPGHVVEAAIDGFSVRDNIGTSVAVLATNTLTLRPNPAKDRLHLEGLEGSSQYMVSIYDMNSKLVYRRANGTAEELQQGISLRGLPAGIYLLRLSSENGERHTQTFIKQ